MHCQPLLLTLLIAATAMSVAAQEPANVRHALVLRATQAWDRYPSSGAATSPTLSTQLDQLTRPLRRLDLQIDAAASCASTACHGGPRPGIAHEYAVRGAEYPLWLENDPHAQSWRTMCSPAATNILQRLGILQDAVVRDQAALDNCLKCHNSTGGTMATISMAPMSAGPLAVNAHGSLEMERSQDFHAEGVGCAGCHGPSENWLKNHYRSNWNDLESSIVGLVPNKNLLARARACASCHVGDSDRDMNHDVIAAGHPALHYEFATFHNMLPKHWREPLRTESKDFEAQLWIAGQIAALDASLALLESRSATQVPAKPWPEFAALDCAACHQSLRLDAKDNSNVRQPRVARLSQWNRFGVEQLLKIDLTDLPGRTDAESAPRELLASLQHLTDTMHSAGVPDRRLTQQAASSARTALDVWLRQSKYAVPENCSAVELKRLAVNSLSDEENLQSWEYAAQSYLAVIAARKAWPPNDTARTLAQAESLRQSLLFLPDRNSPTGKSPSGDSPSGGESHRRRTRDSAEDLLHQLTRRSESITLFE